VFSLPAQPGKLRQRLLHHRRRIDEYFYVAVAGPFQQKGGKFLESSFDEVMIIAMARVDGNRRAVALRERRARIDGGAVIDAEHDDAMRFRP